MQPQELLEKLGILQLKGERALMTLVGLCFSRALSMERALLIWDEHTDSFQE